MFAGKESRYAEHVECASGNDQQRKAHLLRGACAGANSAVTTGNPDDPGTAASNKMQARGQILSRARFKDHHLMQITAELPGQHP